MSFSKSIDNIFRLLIEIIPKRLKDKGHLVSAIHGNLRQHKRDKVILAFVENVGAATDLTCQLIVKYHYQ